MKTNANHRWALGCILLMGLALSACASTSYIGIDYGLPPATESMKGRQVFVQTTDQRPSAETLAPSAKEDFEHFTGLFSLSVGKADEKPMIIGAFDVPTLFKEAFHRRLEDLGAVVMGQAGSESVTVDIAIQEFVLGKEGRQYRAKLTYTAALVHPAGKTVTKTISGNAERMKITGKRDMEKLLGEIFTDMVNRLDLAGLFREAGY
ncbi:MAG: hypothetical protein JEZ11_03105 [Desulfobacterales bacterium]|nr:hypothetical protein [Desulfobacterales bacterium]